jgi:DHA1 family bicyclomycin/chloramphenicol resistance-like MFS transporter
VTAKQNSSLGIVFILGLLAMLMPLSIDMYLPALPVISAQFNVPDGSAQMTLSTYILALRWVSCCTARWQTALGASR